MTNGSSVNIDNNVETNTFTSHKKPLSMIIVLKASPPALNIKKIHTLKAYTLIIIDFILSKATIVSYIETSTLYKFGTKGAAKKQQVPTTKETIREKHNNFLALSLASSS